MLRTFSKAYGLAGMLLGQLVGPLEVVTTLRRIRAPFSVGTLDVSSITLTEHTTTVGRGTPTGSPQC